MVMNAENRALCYYYRNPPPGSSSAILKWTEIARLVWNVDGKTHPTPCSVRKCVLRWRRERKPRGRKKGERKTTKREDRLIKQCFQKARLPRGSAVTSRDVSARLPRSLQGKLCLRTIRNRLAECGYKPTQKAEKTDFLRNQRKARMAFCRAHERRSPAMWAAYLQGCGDLKDFTYFPRKMKARFTRYRCSWTYMKTSERRLPDFHKPKKGRMFGRKGIQSHTERQSSRLHSECWTAVVCVVSAAMELPSICQACEEASWSFLPQLLPRAVEYPCTDRQRALASHRRCQRCFRGVWH